MMKLTYLRGCQALGAAHLGFPGWASPGVTCDTWDSQVGHPQRPFIGAAGKIFSIFGLKYSQFTLIIVIFNRYIIFIFPKTFITLRTVQNEWVLIPKSDGYQYTMNSNVSCIQESIVGH